MNTTRTLEAIQYKRGDLRVLNQLLLPHETVFESVGTIQEGHAVIKTMKTRGAPAIAIVAALSLAVDVYHRHSQSEFKTPIQVVQFLKASLDYLKTSRPTAVNLFDAAAKLDALISAQSGNVDQIVDAYMKAAEKMLVDDVEDNKHIGKYGADFILQNVKDKDHISVLTHCNTGSLATAGWGTALGIIRSLHKEGHLQHAYCTETRPYNQGSRLTAYELVYEHIPATLICDSMASALLNHNKQVQAIVVGADRVAANGDTANKIGTYQLAITAHYHNILFIVAAPSTSIDLNTKTGADIVIEQRPASELVTVAGVDTVHHQPTTVQTAAENIQVWNPSFDVTPASLISAIVTEQGVVMKNNNRYDLTSFLHSK